MKKETFYDEILQRWKKEKKYNNNKSLNERLKVAIKKILRNFTMPEVNKTAQAHFQETEMCRLLRPIDTAVVERHNQFTGARAPTVPD